MNRIIPALLLAFVLVLSACGGNNNVETTMSQQVPEFEATTQSGETITEEDLIGQWLVVDFVFTNCTTVCLPMTSNMKKLQDKLAEEKIENVHLVSFSVDPDNDTPEVLSAYAEEYGANLDNWTFLTGYDFDTVVDISMNSFKNLVAPPPEGDDQVSHGTSFFLVNPKGEIMKNYRGTESDAMDDIVNDLKNLQ